MDLGLLYSHQEYSTKEMDIFWSLSGWYRNLQALLFWGRLLSAWVRNSAWQQNSEGGYCALQGGVQPKGEQPRRVRVCLSDGGEELLEIYFHQGFFQV